MNSISWPWPVHCLSRIIPLPVSWEGAVPCYHPIQLWFTPALGKTHSWKVFVDWMSVLADISPCLPQGFCVSVGYGHLNFPNGHDIYILLPCSLIGHESATLFSCVLMWALSQWYSTCCLANFLCSMTPLSPVCALSPVPLMRTYCHCKYLHRPCPASGCEITTNSAWNTATMLDCGHLCPHLWSCI